MVFIDEENSFLEEIAREPFDVMPRLIYADWLDEQTDPRGELLRVHCELTEILTDDSRFPMLVEREKFLLQWCHRDWYEQIAIGYRFHIDGVLPERVGTSFDLPDASILLAGRLQAGRAWSMQPVRIPMIDGSHHTHARILLERMDGFVDSLGCSDTAVAGLYLQFSRTEIMPEDVRRDGICVAAASPYSSGFRDDPPKPITRKARRKWWPFGRKIS